jgi:D-serine deaminase-like pyridoxal phosphate-dependent protein
MSDFSDLSSENPWYRIENIDQLDTPALVVYPGRVRENIRLAVEIAGSPTRLRPHVKTHKSPDAAGLMLAAGIRQFKCATIAEAEMLAIAGAEDVLLAYQPIGPKAVRLAALIRKYPDTLFSCLIDRPEAATAMAHTFAAAGLNVPVYLDLNLGMDRTGIAPGPEALELYRHALRLEGITLVGLHAYDGHIRDADINDRTKKCNEAFAAVTALQTEIAALRPDFPPLTIIAGGSPTFPIHARRNPSASGTTAAPSATAVPAEFQCSPGTFVYWDKGYADGCKEQPFSPAALVVTRVISLRGDTRLCLDLGHKSIAAENEIGRRVHFLNAPDLRPVSQSEEHLVVEAGPGHGYAIGDIFYGVPYHICPTVALYERAFTVEDGQLTGDWKNTARDRTLTV